MAPIRDRRAAATDREETSPADDLEGRLSWLWSTPRSGAELMLGLLAHPLRPDPSASLSFRPPPARATVAPFVIPIDELCLGAHLAPWPGQAVEVGDSWVPGTIINLSEGRDPYLLSRASESCWREPLRRLALARIGYAADRAAAHVRGVGPTSPIVIKEVASSHAADRVAALLPRSRVVVLCRDPRDVVASQLREPDSFETDAAPVAKEERAELVAEAARLWAMTADVCTAALTAQDEALGLRLRYEDLLAEPRRELESALKLLGIDRPRGSIEEAVGMSPIGEHPPDREPLERDLGTGVGAWREELAGDEVASIERIAGPRLAALGYEPA